MTATATAALWTDEELAGFAQTTIEEMLAMSDDTTAPYTADSTAATDLERTYGSDGEAHRAEVVIESRTHLGHLIEVVDVPAYDARTETVNRYDGRTYLTGSSRSRHLEARVDGSPVWTPKGDAVAVANKIVATLDKDAFERGLLPELERLVHATTSRPGTTPVSETGIKVGEVAYTYAQGRYRRGIVTKLGRSNVTVAYTTASSRGAVYQPSRPGDDVYRDGHATARRNAR